MLDEIIILMGVKIEISHDNKMKVLFESSFEMGFDKVRKFFPFVFEIASLKVNIDDL